MRNTALLAIALVFAGANLAVALPAVPLGGAGQSLSDNTDGMMALVKNENKKKKSLKKSSGGGTNMQNMPAGHKM